MTASSRAHSFNMAAAQYAASRPSYPPALFDVIEQFTGRPLAAARVADVGAGTRIATALLRQRGADVIAVEPGAAMAAQFRITLPDVPIVRGDGNALPLADTCHDLITYAQSWQWTDTTRSVPEALRVLHPGGALAIWWNTTAFDVTWISERHQRIAHHCGVEPSSRVRPNDRDVIQLAGLSGLRVARSQVRWSRVVSFDLHLANISSRSAFLVLAQDDQHAFRSEERRRLREMFADEVVEETYVVDLLVATRP
ncbi:class I SAM-dependent methyltransferase [Streptomyces sp. NPDC051665]|uniref:class I SAM-dependent methyltransferase n=1 Tax=Streptomyces sp. NPDC051665 TaxID=3154647 RepID=UPI00344120FC